MHNIKTDKSTIEAFYETALAELGSALEMMAACKISEKPSHAYGYLSVQKMNIIMPIFLNQFSQKGQDY